MSTTNITETANDIPCPSHVFFAGGGWSCAYYIGCYRAILERWPESETKKIIWAGNSAGSAIAAVCAIGVKPEKIEYIYEQLIKYSVMYGIFGVSSILHDYMMDQVLGNDINAYKKCNGRLFIGITLFPYKHRQVSQWSNNDELRITIHQSMHIPYWMTNLKRTPDGKRAIDGGFSKTYHRFNDTTLVLSAYGDVNKYTSCKNNNKKNCGNRNEYNDIPDMCGLNHKSLSDSVKFYKTNKNIYDDLKSKGYKMMLEWDGNYRIPKFDKNCKNNIYSSNINMRVSQFFARNLDYGQQNDSNNIRNNNRNKIKRDIVMFPLAMIAWCLRLMEETIEIKKWLFYLALIRLCYYIFRQKLGINISGLIFGLFVTIRKVRKATSTPKRN